MKKQVVILAAFTALSLNCLAYDFAEDGFGKWEDSSYDENSFAFSVPDGTSDKPSDHLKIRVSRNTHHELQGKASSDFGKLKFKSRLFANNDIRFSLFIDHEDEELTFQGYIDIVNEELELDGGGAVLTSDHRKILASTSQHLTELLVEKYEGEVPLHGVMLIQMMSYWSKSPDNFVHEKQSVVAGY